MKSFHEWLKETTTAPAIPGTETVPVAPSAPPAPRPRPSPFKPNTRPKPASVPKGQKPQQTVAENTGFKKKVTEAWENIHPSVRDRLKKHPEGHAFRTHSILSMPARGGNETYGELIAKDSHEAMEKFLGQNEVRPDISHIESEAKNAYMAITKIEYEHREDLEWEAVDLVADYLNLPDSSLLHAHLARPNEKGQGYKNITSDMGGGENEPKPRMPMNNELRDHINRRISFNMLNQGHALNAMDSLHVKIESKLAQIDPRLPGLYKKLSATSKARFWFTDAIERLNSPAFRKQALASEVEIVKDEQEDRYEVYASGQCFIFLIQELLKGAFELIGEHAFPPEMEQEKVDSIIKVADNHSDEAWHFLYGPEFWRIFSRMLPLEYQASNPHKLQEILMQLNRLDPKKTNNLLLNMVEEYYELKNKGIDMTQRNPMETEFARQIKQILDENDEQP